MKCMSCGAEMVTGQEDHAYDSSGLRNVVLVGVVVDRCPSCGEFEVELPRVLELHRVLAQALVGGHGRLVGAEIRFLRKQVGWSGADFARQMGVTPETVSRWENDRLPMNSTKERFLRLLVAHLAPVESYDVARLAEVREAEAPLETIRVTPDARGWQAAA